MPIVVFRPYQWMPILSYSQHSIRHGVDTALTKMPFGLNQAQYFFQFYMDQNFRDSNSTTNLIADDLMVHGETEEEHDRQPATSFE